MSRNCSVGNRTVLLLRTCARTMTLIITRIRQGGLLGFVCNRCDLSNGRFRDHLCAGVEGRLFVPLNHVVNLLAMYGQLRRCLDADFHGIALDPQDLYDNTAIDDDAFVEFAGEDKHEVYG